MNFQDAVKSGYQNYVTFSGRASRPAYWWWSLFQIVVSVVIFFVFGPHFVPGSDTVPMHLEGGLIGNLWSLANLLPSLAVGIRRLHDIDKSGWWTLILFVPLVGIILLIVWYCTKGTPGANRFGPEVA